MKDSARRAVAALLLAGFAAGAPAQTASHRPDALLAHGFENAAQGPRRDADAARFLAQATFGPSTEAIAQLRAQGYDCAVLDAGVSGDTSAGGLARLDWMLADEPSHVIVELGGNDGLRALPPEEMARSLDQIIRRLKEEGIAVLLTGMLAPPNLGPEYGAEFNRIYPELAAAHGVLLYPFFLDGVAAEPTLNQSDGIHPNEAGVRVIVERMLPGIRRLIEQTRDAVPAG